MVYLQQIAAWKLLLHVCHVFLHVLRREHADISQAQRLENIFVEVVVQAQSRDPLNYKTSPIDVGLTHGQFEFSWRGVGTYAIFPCVPRLVHQRGVQNVARIA